LEERNEDYSIDSLHRMAIKTTFINEATLVCTRGLCPIMNTETKNSHGIQILQGQLHLAKERERERIIESIAGKSGRSIVRFSVI
jgi:hypothetical protein